ncbi:MAG: hypothetical protein ACK5MU_00950 [Candidatus Saccharimonadales bacterium]
MKSIRVTKKQQRAIVAGCVGAIALSGVVALFVVDYGVIADRIKAMGYTPDAEMQTLIDEIALTERGELVLKASQPTLLARAEFNNACQSYMPDVPVLGCYTAERIYVYDIENEEVNGIRQSTLAHESLHAVWYRMNDGEREKLTQALEDAYEARADEWKSRLDKYPKESFHDELHAIVGTEVAVSDLPEVLQKHYARYFDDHGKVVNYYVAYSDKFEELQKEADTLYAEITANQEKITAETTNYNDGIEALNTAIEDFNRRAANGAFTSMAAFNAERATLVGRQNTLEALYTQIQNMVTATNQLIEKYNNNVARTQALVDSINSNTKTPEAEIKDEE